jgi:hypothetical protein
MERLERDDAFLRFVVDDLVSRSHPREKALEIVFIRSWKTNTQKHKQAASLLTRG